MDVTTWRNRAEALRETCNTIQRERDELRTERDELRARLEQSIHANTTREIALEDLARDIEHERRVNAVMRTRIDELESDLAIAHDAYAAATVRWPSRVNAQ